MHIRPYSIFYQADDITCGAALMIKLHRRNGAPDPCAAQSEFDALQRLAPFITSSRRFSVPIARAVLHEHAAIVRDFIPGRTLREHVLDARLGPRDIARLFVDAGHWLRWFNGCHPLPSGRIDTERILTSCVADLEKAGRGLGKLRVAKRALAALRASSPAVAMYELPRSWIHGDFKAANLIFSGDKIVGFDFNLKNESIVLFDWAQFLNQFELACLIPAGLRLWPWRKRIIAAFVQGYAEDGDKPPADAITFVRLAHALQNWAHYNADNRPALRKLYSNICYRLILYSLTTELERRIARAGS